MDKNPKQILKICTRARKKRHGVFEIYFSVNEA